MTASQDYIACRFGHERPAAAQYTDGVVKIGVLTDMEKLEEAGLSARTP
jgi:hypothetical protein